MNLNHKHLIVNAFVQDPPKEGDEQKVIDWMNKLIKDIGMKIVFGPFAHYCKAEGNNGITASCNIETSHCSLHCWDKLEKPILRFDLYSCADFDVQFVLRQISRLSDVLPNDLNYVILDRNEKEIKMAWDGQ